MSFLEQIEAQNEAVGERYELAMERIEDIVADTSTLDQKYRGYFRRTGAYLLQIKEVINMFEEDEWDELGLDACQQMNYDLYADLLSKSQINAPDMEGYEISYANPAYAMEKLGESYGKILCFLYTELRACVAYAFEQRLFDITIAAELFIQIFNLMEEENENTEREMREAIYYYFSDYCDVTLPTRTREMLDPSFSFATEVIMESDLDDLRYLYRFGEYISENEIKIARFLNEMPREQIQAMARTYTEGFRKGFELARIDLSKKKTVNIRYPLGFERIVKEAILQFREMGLEPTIYRTGVSSMHKKVNKTGYFGTSVNPQYDYDHRFDQAMYLDRPLMERKLVNLRLGYEQFEELAEVYAGPAVIETFGEREFAPVNKPEALSLSEKQQKVSVEYQRESGILVNEFIPSDQYSFTIIAYPIPEIGSKFKEIFAETVKVNTLDVEKYKRIQQCLIDALDQGEYVRVLGKGDNRTALKVQLAAMEDPQKQTIFENCLADVNIPVGEVFTSPKLEGTNGVLHVTKVYLNAMCYKDLQFIFEDGKVKDYTCKNFQEEEQNKKLVKDNILYQYDSLPIGEFAIGTNTTAYAMGQKYDISGKLPILIAEKTGPHFALGDTCYSMSEENRVYNPDGKEMIAKENSCSKKRHSNMEEAYFQCHTDITIPYDELGEITVYKKNGESITLIKDGKFVLAGTEQLNEALEQM